MTEIILALIAVSILLYHAYFVRESNKEKKELVDALIARSAAELRDLRVAQNTKIKVEPSRKGELPGFVPIEELDDDTFMKANRETYGGK